MFVTLCYAQIDPTTSDLTYVNAGHNPPLFYRRERGGLTELARTGIAMGVDESRPYEQATLRLESGDFILFYTDGVTDASNADQEFFGLDYLQQVVLAHRDASAAEMIAALRRELGVFVGTTPQFDDITAVVVKRL
jgi:sigma-B regulation protein RsbU (phosphoserine phosphatase)